MIRAAGLVAALGVAVGWTTDRASEPMVPDGRPAEVIVEEYEAVTMPTWCDGNDPEEIARFERAIRKGCTQQASLALELYRSHPDHARVPELMKSRWILMCNGLEMHAAVDREVANFVTKKSRPALRRGALWARAHARLDLEEFTSEQKLAAIEEAIREEPEERSGAFYLIELATHHVSDMQGARALCDRVAAYYGDEGDLPRVAKWLGRSLDRVGKPLPFRLPEVGTDRMASDEDHRGRPLLVFAWSGPDPTWGRELLDEVNALHEEYGPRGLAVVGVSRPYQESGPEVLRAKLPSFGIDWPVLLNQEEPNPLRSHGSRAACLFLLDGEGVLRAVGANRKVIEPTLRRSLGLAEESAR